MTGRGVQYYEIVRGDGTEKIGFFYDEIVIELLKRAGMKGMTVTALRRMTGISDSTLRSILDKFIEMNRIEKFKGRSEKNLKLFLYKIKNVSNVIIK